MPEHSVVEMQNQFLQLYFFLHVERNGTAGNSVHSMLSTSLTGIFCVYVINGKRLGNMQIFAHQDNTEQYPLWYYKSLKLILKLAEM